MGSISVRGVTKTFQLAAGTVTAVDTVDLHVPDGGFAALIGPSGCGKSTLLRLVADILQPTNGEILIGGQPPSAARKGQRIGFVFQDPTLLPWRSVLDNVRLPLQLSRGSDTSGSRTPEELLELVGLRGFENARPHQLSGGMKQRVAIARALALRPEVLLLDEPFGALDEITRHRMNIELLRIWAETGVTALLVTHSIDEAALMSDTVYVMSERPGRITSSVRISLPRPRALEMMSGEAFFAAENQLRTELFGGATLEAC